MTSLSWRLSADSSVTWSAAAALDVVSRGRCAMTSSHRDTGSSGAGRNDVTAGGGGMASGGGKRKAMSCAARDVTVATGEPVTKTRGNWSAAGDGPPASATVSGLHGGGGGGGWWLMIDAGLWWCEVESTEPRRRWSELRRCSAHARCSAASALLKFSCFFHFVRRFWNHIFTYTSSKSHHWTFSATVHDVKIKIIKCHSVGSK